MLQKIRIAPRKTLVISAFVVALIIFIGIAFKTNRVPSDGFQTKEQLDVSSLTRRDIQVVKGLLEPGLADLGGILTEDRERIRNLGVNTIYIYADYSYEDGSFVLTSEIGSAFSKPTQEELQQVYVSNIIKAKQAGFAVHLAIAFGGGRNQSFGVPLERFLADAREADLTWAALSEKYKVESFAPSSEIDFQIFREYYSADWSNQAKHDKAAQISNDYHDEILPEIRKRFKGKVIYQAGLWNPLLGSKGYDVFGTGLNNVGAELADFRKLTKQVYGYAETNAKRQGSSWMVTEFWAPIREQGAPNQETKLFYTGSGVAYEAIQHEFYKIAIEEYNNWIGDVKPSGFAFTQYANQSAKVKDRPAEDIIKNFYNQLIKTANKSTPEQKNGSPKEESLSDSTNEYKIFPEVWSSNGSDGQTYEYKVNCFGDYSKLEECFLWTVTKVSVINPQGTEFLLNKDFNINPYSGEVTRRWVLYGPAKASLPQVGQYTFNYFENEKLLLSQKVSYSPEIIDFPKEVTWKQEGKDLVVSWTPPVSMKQGMWYKVIIFPQNQAVLSQTFDWNARQARLPNVPLVTGDSGQLNVSAFFKGGYSYSEYIPFIWE